MSERAPRFTLAQKSKLTFEEELAAICTQTDPDAWYPEHGDGQTGRIAKAICQGCPLRARRLGGNGRCLDLAFENKEEYGIWGGLGPTERANMLRQGVTDDPPNAAHGGDWKRAA